MAGARSARHDRLDSGALTREHRYNAIVMPGLDPGIHLLK